VDFASNAEQICDKALNLAGSGAGELSLVHVLEPIITDSAFDSLPALPADFEEAMLNNARSRLTQLGEKYSIPEARLFLELGDTRREIIRIAEEQGADLIVVGSHGRHGVALLLGSTANAVLHHAHCDVLAVRITA